MRFPTSGSKCPAATYTWLIANQAIGATANFLVPAPIVCNGARQNNGQVVVTARGALPRTAGGVAPHFEAFISADNAITLNICNSAAAALVALGADVTLDLQVLPVNP